MDISILKNISDVIEGLENRIKKASYITGEVININGGIYS